MLTGFQAEVIAFSTDGGFVCERHVESEFAVEEDSDMSYWERISALEDASGYTAYSRYSLDESFPGGLWCDDCGDELIEPAEDYCTEHDAWRNTSYEANDGTYPWCDVATDSPTEFRYDMEPCPFPDADPNPAVPRWVPCGVCGAGDGQPHDLTKHAS